MKEVRREVSSVKLGNIEGLGVAVSIDYGGDFELKMRFGGGDIRRKKRGYWAKNGGRK